jgi:hypothetical protein
MVSPECGYFTPCAPVPVPLTAHAQAVSVYLQDHTWLTEYNRGAGHGRVHHAFDIYLVALYWSSMTMSTM